MNNFESEFNKKNVNNKWILPLFYFFIIISIIFFVFIVKTDGFGSEVKEIIIDDSVKNTLYDYGSSYNLDVNIVGNDDKDYKVTYTSSNPHIVVVDDNGNVGIVGNETTETIIKIQAGDLIEEIPIQTVKVEEVVKVNGISVDKKEVSVRYGETDRINAIVNPDNATNKNLIWKSSNPNIVSVDNLGNINVLENKDANVTLTAMTTEGNYSEKVNVIVNHIDYNQSVSSISFESKEISLKYMDTIKLKPIISPNNASDKYTWSSSNPNLVSVDNNGVIKVLDDKDDSAVISVKTSKNVTASIIVKVYSSEIESISLNINTLNLTIGDQYKLDTAIKPLSAFNKSISWNSSSNSIVSINEKTGVMKALKEGEATVTISSKNNKKASVKVIVKNPNKITGSFLKAGSVNGNPTIVDSNGNKVILKGFNLGGWLSRSYSMTSFVALANSKENFLKTGYSCINNESFFESLTGTKVFEDGKDKVFNSRKNVLSVENAFKLSDIYYDNFITEEDFDMIALTGANVVRLPIEYTFFTESYYSYYSSSKKLDKKSMQLAFSKIDKIIEMAKQRGIYVILDLHLVPGRQNSGGWCDDATFFDDTAESKQYRKDVIELWGHIAYKYKNEVAVAGYDILNEPETTEKKLSNFYNNVYYKIRQYDKNHIIFMEETCIVCGHTGANVKYENDKTIGRLPDPLSTGTVYDDNTKKSKWINVVYSVHDYPNLDVFATNDEFTIDTDKLIARAKSRLSLIKEKMKKYNVPYYVGEFTYLGSTTDKSKNIEKYKNYLYLWNYMMDEYEKAGLSYTPWTYKANNELYYGLIFYGTKDNNNAKFKVNLLNDDFETLKTKLSYSTKSSMKFNDDYYLMFTNNYSNLDADSYRCRYGREVDILYNNIVYNKKTINIKLGSKISLNARVRPTTAIDKNIIWSSSDSSIASVNSNTGEIIGNKKGMVTITVTHHSPVKSLLNKNIKQNYTDSYTAKNELTSLNYSFSQGVTIIVE